MDDKADPLFAIERRIVNSYWTLDQLSPLWPVGCRLPSFPNKIHRSAVDFIWK